jgi:proline iminopeptidase
VVRELYDTNRVLGSGVLNVSGIHSLYYEEFGTRGGCPAVFLHGGPGGGIQDWHRGFFDPDQWHVALFDQRGCGRSTPHAELRENTTWDLVADIEKLRVHLGFDKWTVFGGSWGSTLALAYAITHPDRVSALVLRGIFLLRRSEIDWFYQFGTSELFPDAFENYVAPIPEHKRGKLVESYYEQLTSSVPEVRRTAARAWSLWEGTTVKLLVDPALQAQFGEDEFAEAFARIECHYFVNRGFFETDNFLLENVNRIRHIPAVIVQGRYDVVCPMRSAWDLHKTWPEAEFRVIGDAGHAASEPGIRTALLDATDGFARSLKAGA